MSSFTFIPVATNISRYNKTFKVVTAADVKQSLAVMDGFVFWAPFSDL